MANIQRIGHKRAIYLLRSSKLRHMFFYRRRSEEESRHFHRLIPMTTISRCLQNIQTRLRRSVGHTPDPIDPRQKFHPELAIDGFTAIDGTVRFYSFVNAIMLRLRASQILDFGAGRGAVAFTQSAWLRHLSDLRTSGAHVTAYDVDPVVRKHAVSHVQYVGVPVGPLPFPTCEFDMIVSDMTFEHLEHPKEVAEELLRVLKPGGYICARTPNKFGYVKIVASFVPNRLHAGFLRRVQPDRHQEDVFPTFYRLNSRAAARRYFPGCDVITLYDMPEPAYYFRSRLLYGGLLALHRILPRVLSTTILVFIRKPSGVSYGG